MVKGISRQVIVVQSPDRRLFEQAIFILKDGQPGVTDEELLKEATRLMNTRHINKGRIHAVGPIWACGGALLTGIIWLMTVWL